MEGHGVIVKYSQMVNGTNEELSCSGMYLGHGIVLTHGTLLADLFKDEKAQPIIEQLSSRSFCARLNQQTTCLNSLLKDVEAKVEVILPSKERPREVVSINCDSCTASAVECYPQCQTSVHDQNKHSESIGFVLTAAHVDRIILHRDVYECLDLLMPASQGWKLLEENQGSLSPDLEKLIMSTFVILTLSENQKAWMNEEADDIVLQATKEILLKCIPAHKGDFVFVESSPFGCASPTIFLNSVSQGIICNTAPQGHGLLLTDARCVTGSEGAPVFKIVSGQRRPCGVVTSPFCWRGGEWLGLTLLAPLSPVLQTLLQSYISLPRPQHKKLTIQDNNQSFSRVTPCEHQSKDRFTDEELMQGLLKDICRSVVSIKCGDGWGSGFVISTSPGIILTCAHVTYKAINKEVTILLSDGRRLEGSVIHQTQPFITCRKDSRPPSAGYSMWDLAVVVTSSPLHHSLSLATSLPSQGVSVVMAGYGIFPSRVLPTATLSRGVISKVVTLPSSSLTLPASISNSVHKEKHKLAANDKDNNRRLNDTSKNNNITSHHDLSVMRNAKSDGDSTQCLMKLGHHEGSTCSKCFPVPVIIQTTCAVYAGGSGGPVVSVHPTKGLQVVGIVVCNMQDSNSTTFPHVNLAIPIPSITTILNTFIHTSDKAVLQYLDIECATASDLWGLTHPLRSSL